MPEGPEVRIHKDAIKHLESCKIIDIESYIPVHSMFIDFIPSDLIGYTIIGINNKGKTIFWEMVKDAKRKYLSIQFSMGGSFRISENKNNIFKIVLDNGEHIFYNDVRHFGKWKLLNDEQYEIAYNRLGVDLLIANDYDIGMIVKTIRKKHFSWPIKVLLMDQQMIGGIGNIYATEALFKMKILPMRKVIDIQPIDVFELIKATQDIMKQSYLLQGMSIHSFKTINGEDGNGKDLLQIYNKSKCPICDNDLTKVDVGGRTSKFCSICQK